MHSHDARLAHQEFAGHQEQAVPKRRWVDFLAEECDYLLARLGRGRSPKRGKKLLGRRAIHFAVLPATANLVGALLVLAPWPIAIVVTVGGIAGFVLQEGIGQRAVNRLGVPPADGLESSEGIGGVDRFVSD